MYQAEALPLIQVLVLDLLEFSPHFEGLLFHQKLPNQVKNADFLMKLCLILVLY